MKSLLFTICLAAFCLSASGQSKPRTFSLETTSGLQPTHVSLKSAVHEGKKSVQVLDTASGITGEKKYALLREVAFRNGIIEIEVAGKPAAGAVESARGFVGIAFRVDTAKDTFECIYLRPSNGRAEDQVRRNHSVQYISYPDFPWQKLRKDYPEKYESYVDLEVGRWTKIKIVVKDSTARLYVHGAAQPTLIISDLKLGAGSTGGIGLWVGSGTEAYFRNLRVTPLD